MDAGPWPDRCSQEDRGRFSRRIKARIMSFLQSNGGPHERYQKLYDEAKSLTIESVFLPWPKKPSEAMVEFNCPTENEGRRWRCALVDGVPQVLAFDS